MKFLSAIILIICLFISSTVLSQNLTDAKQYLDAIDKQHTQVATDFVKYNNAVSHKGNAKKSESQRTKLLDEVNKAETNINAMAAFQDDKEYRDSSAYFMKICFDLLTNEYNKIASTEDAAEKSVDKMKDFLLAKKAAALQLETANLSYHKSYMKFADKYINNKDAISDKVQQAASVNAYYDTVYMIFFKTYKAESYLVEAVQKKDGVSVEQNKKIVYQNSQEGLKQLDTLDTFKEDKSLVEKCKAVLSFYAQESDEKFGDVSDYFPEAKTFQKTRSDYEKKPGHTKQEVNDYTKAVKVYNKALKKFNKSSHSLTDKRSKAVDKWNSAAEDFLNKYLPKA
jgi:hypothetical protein